MNRSSAAAAHGASAPDMAFDVEPHREALLALLRDIEAWIAGGEAVAAVSGTDDGALRAILRRHPRDGRGFFARSEIIAGYRYWREREAFAFEEAEFVSRVRRRPVRSHSGVTPVTVLTQPFPCPGKCVFCPNDVRMPKSYLSDEPGAQRAAANRFDPYLQTWNRLAAYRAIGHPTDKIELIVLGGTWSFYPEAYQVWFVARLFEALNDFGAGRDGREGVGLEMPDFTALPARIDGREQSENPYNRMVGAFLDSELGRARTTADAAGAGANSGWKRLEAAQRENETAGARSVGLSLETRPDHVDADEVVRLRRLGATKVQIGIQSLSDRVLALNKRGHDVAATRRALRLLRAAGFKLHAHWMPNLLGATPDSDRRGFERLFSDRDFRPDELKVYPCSLIESAELMQFHARGDWRPYTHDELLDVVTAALEATPRSVRLTRVIRDISSDDIVDGNKLTNFREIAARELERRGGRAVDIRAREIRADAFDPATLVLRESAYATSVGSECFLEFVTPEDRIVAFLRLSLPAADRIADITERLPELGGAAMIREVHVYGGAVGLGEAAQQSGEAQHLGLGTRLVREAWLRASAAGYVRLAVISAVGTRDWYRRLDFVDAGVYQVCEVEPGSEGVPS